MKRKPQEYTLSVVSVDQDEGCIRQAIRFVIQTLMKKLEEEAEGRDKHEGCKGVAD
ncbi:hypothetical protein [Carboxydocella sp. ULO1]|uniref:hypothetical protein n=1 Tax=Carboxydocella sp. ULO1 TaxID=1926599 RepID=UPI0009D0F7E3|nr:hypothetical protein [Carboxydocella sp. ULO1]GAW28961.1 hypothetical protein ULO1_15310 [Carboxydocella sp. ULO1]